MDKKASALRRWLGYESRTSLQNYFFFFFAGFFFAGFFLVAFFFEAFLLAGFLATDFLLFLAGLDLAFPFPAPGAIRKDSWGVISSSSGMVIL
ncbi:MAG: hypothetical protein IPP19_10705 [Verrucomicrobia bacterium]|nr:hypothetical protein [Verrucomicrobiota bacterium]